MNETIIKPEKRLLRFGIPSLDRLFGPYPTERFDCGIQLRPEGIEAKNDDAKDLHVTMCITGPSGTGKSLLGLHLASRYWADCHRLSRETQGEKAPNSRVIYISTDLGHDMAQATWKTFGLNKPNKRNTPFRERLPNSKLSDGTSLEEIEVGLQKFDQQDLHSFARFLRNGDGNHDGKENSNDGEIAFVDLAEATAGDDWGFVTRLVSLLTTPKEDEPHHLIIIDAVEGLEMLTGETDSHGQQRSRRSRVAQILRAAAKKCHVLLVLEEDDAHKHPTEEYVTDIVIRLRVARERDYLRRSIEVVKCRGQQLIRGEHHYLIRGSTPKTSLIGAAPSTSTDLYPDHPRSDIAYLQVIRSLHSLSSLILEYERSDTGIHGPIDSPLRHSTEDSEPTFSSKQIACFDTPKFGRILPRLSAEADPHADYHGLFRGKVTSLIGDEATLKSRLGRAFLAGGFMDPKKSNPGDPEEKEAGVLITTFNLSKEAAIDLLVRHLNPSTDELREPAKDSMQERLFCRQLEIHHLNSSLLFHIIRRNVESALLLLDPHGEPNRSWIAHSDFAKYVRVVIDDWSVIQSTHPEIRDDPLFLPFLVKYFQRVGVTALIISTQPGRPEEILQTSAEHQLRALADYHLYTWHVPFFGTDRIALTAVPSVVRSARPSVGELREARTLDNNQAMDCNERLWIDPHFELYQGLEKQTPRPVPLELRLYSGATGYENFTMSNDGLINRIFGDSSCGSVIVPESQALYSEIRDFSILHGTTHRDHTIVMQVDEYWKESGNQASLEKAYLNQRSQSRLPSGEGFFPSQRNDPFHLFQPPLANKRGAGESDGGSPAAPNSNGAAQPDSEPLTKACFFNVPGYYPPTEGDKGNEWVKYTSGVPYLWDFGFLLLRVRAWKGAINNLTDDDQKILVGRVFQSLSGKFSDDKFNYTPVKWRDFFQACKVVANWHNRPHWPEMAPFDLDMLTPQSFASLLLEVWASELFSADEELAKLVFPMYRSEPPTDGARDWSLIDLLERDTGGNNTIFRYTLFQAWALLAEVLDPSEITMDFHKLSCRAARNRAVAERHWYSTGSLSWQAVGGDNPVIPARMPGTFTTRGDWFLVVGKESRSLLLGERAIDLLCRRRANAERLECGVGLPVRRLNSESWQQENYCEGYRQTLTAMANFERGGRRRIIRFGDFLEQLSPLGDESGNFRWLWRSRIAGYHRHGRAFEQWLGRLVVESCKRMQEIRAGFQINEFKIYDSLDGFSGDKIKLKSGAFPDSDLGKKLDDAIQSAWERFSVRCDTLVSELRQQPEL